MPGWSGTLAQRVSIGIGVFLLVLGIMGLMTNPDFGTGSDLTSKQFIIDWNGWHAVSAIALAVIAFVAATRPLWAVVFLAGNAIGNVGESAWAVGDSTPLGLLYFPNIVADVVPHLGIAGVSLFALLKQLARNRVATATTGA